MLSQDACDAASGRSANPSRDDLDRGHQWISEEKRPGKTETELRASLRVGGNAAWVVIGGTGNETRSEDLEQAWAAGPDNGTAHFRVINDHAQIRTSHAINASALSYC